MSRIVLPVCSIACMYIYNFCFVSATAVTAQRRLRLRYCGDEAESKLSVHKRPTHVITSSLLYLAQVMAYKLKLASPGGETRLLTFSNRPSWSDVQSKVVSYFGIQETAVAVSYEDSDGDIVTMNSQEELQDYLQSCYKAGQTGKLTVVDKARDQHPMQKKEYAFAEDLGEEVEEGLPAMGPTMFIEVDDGGWQRVPHIPEIYSVREEDGLVDSDGGHAFVEVVDSDAASGKKDSQAASPEQTSNHGIATRQLRHKGKGKAYSASEATKSTSSASVIDDDFPTKPSVHVYDVSDNGRSPWSTAQGNSISLAGGYTQ